jgi:hypothetical protein
VSLRAVLSALFAVAVSASSAVTQASGSRGGVILALPTSPRALGLADASAGALADAWSVFNAPARLPSLRSVAAAVASEAYLVSTQLSAAAFTVPVGAGALGIGATLLDYGSIPEIASPAPGIDGVETGRTVSAQDQAIVLSYGVPVSWVEGMSVGASAAVVNSRVADLSGTGGAASLGMAWASRNGWDVALGVQHLGPALELGATSGPLPLTARAAIAAPARQLGSVFFRPLGEFRAERDGGATIAAATEGEWATASGAALQVRGGYRVRIGNDRDDRWPVSLGVGLVLGSWAIDYAPQRFTSADQFTHRFGVRYARAKRAGAGSR